MSTDTAAIVSKIVIVDQIPLNKIEFVDGIVVNIAEDLSQGTLVAMSESQARECMGPKDDEDVEVEAAEDEMVQFMECTEVSIRLTRANLMAKKKKMGGLKLLEDAELVSIGLFLFLFLFLLFCFVFFFWFE